jgi:ABC-2 type transport system ATP-binding protein
MGLAYPTAGSVKIFGESALEVSHKAHVGFLPERPYFYEYLTALEFLDFYGQLFNIPAPVRRKRAGELLERVNLSAVRDTPLRKFSKGMLQRVGIAQALINDPRLVVLDEPMSGLDPLGRMLIRDIIVDLRRQGKTVFFSTHILSDVELICDRVGILVGGRRMGEGTLDELLARKTRFIEIVARPAAGGMERLEAALRPLSIELLRQGDQVLARVQHEVKKQDALRIVLEHGAEIESVVPRRESLEDLFMDELAAAKRAGATVSMD